MKYSYTILFLTILKKLKYATNKTLTVTYVFDVVIKSLLGTCMSCRLLMACHEIRNRHFIDKIKHHEESKLWRKRCGEGEDDKNCTCLVI